MQNPQFSWGWRGRFFLALLRSQQDLQTLSVSPFKLCVRIACPLSEALGLRLTSSQRKEMLKSDFLGSILPTSGPKARKCLNWTSWGPFCRLLDPMPENAKIGPPGTYFADFWTQGQKILKSDLLGPILPTSGPKARKCLNRTSLDLFCRLRDPRQENDKIGLPGTHFADFWTQARKCLNRTSWDPFCRLLDPRRENAKIGHPGTYFADFWIDFGKQILTLFAKP